MPKPTPMPYFHLSQTCKQIQSHINQRDFKFTTHKLLQDTLVRMYEKCGCLVDARQVFDQMTERDLISWNIIIAAYKRHGRPHEALTLFHQMQPTGVQPDRFTFATILPACAKMGALEDGMDIHQIIIEKGLLSDVVVASALVDMYAKCGSICKAHELFDKMPQRDVVSWNAMIAGYGQNGFVEKAVEAFKQMQMSGLKPDASTFASVLLACAKMGALEQGMGIHQSIIESAFLSNVVVANALVDMYAKCGSVHKARELFDKMPEKNVVSWTAMIAGYTQNRFVEKAGELFNKMPQRDVVSWNTIIAGYVQNGFVEKAVEAFKQMQLSGVKPVSSTFASILPACAKMGALEQGTDIHQSIMESGFLSNVVVANSLVDMYAKCGSIHKARELFDKMRERDVVSWTAMIAGYAQNGFVEKALETFKQMQSAGVMPNSITFASILPACAKMGALEQGADIHHSVMESGFLSNVEVVNALVDMYAKCGSIHKARELFDKMRERNVVSWTAMIAGYAQNGLCKDALKLFELMKHSGTYPNHVSFTCVLLACSHVGLVDESCKYFNGMSATHCITPTVDHYVCMVDLLGRAGYLEEALNFIIKMPIKPVVVVWMCLLGACRAHKNIGLGLFTATLLFEMDPQNAATYVLLSNMYAEVGRWSEVQMVRRLMKDRGIKKIPGCSWIEGHKMVHAFCVGDRSHPQTREIYSKLEKLSWEMKVAGYFPDSKHVLIDVDKEEKELLVCYHSEMLAIVFGLLNTPTGATIRVIKNLRVCIYCHTATKFISKNVTRQIVVRDANRFHHFKQGQCSCGDYW